MSLNYKKIVMHAIIIRDPEQDKENDKKYKIQLVNNSSKKVNNEWIEVPTFVTLYVSRNVYVEQIKNGLYKKGSRIIAEADFSVYSWVYNGESKWKLVMSINEYKGEMRIVTEKKNNITEKDNKSPNDIDNNGIEGLSQGLSFESSKTTISSASTTTEEVSSDDNYNLF